MPTVGTLSGRKGTKYLVDSRMFCRFFLFFLCKKLYGAPAKTSPGPKQCMAAMAERECSRLGFMKRFNILMPTLEHPVDNHGNGTVARNVAGCTKRVHSDIEGDHQCLLFLTEA